VTRLILRGFWEWTWAIIILMDLAIAAGHLTQHHWHDALTSLTSALLFICLAGFRRLLIRAMEEAEKWYQRAVRVEADLYDAGLHVAGRGPDGSPVFLQRKETK
jgi:hypothetical protein